MKAWRLREFGLDHICLEAQEDPGPLDAGQVRIRMLAASLNFRDWLVATGQYDPRMSLPLTPGSDGVGIVVELGANVSRWKIGDRVIPTFSSSWISGPFSRKSRLQTLGGPVNGTLAQSLVCPDFALVAAPSNLTNHQAATLTCAATTAWNALCVERELRAGETVLVQGTGGVSIFALQIAKARQARVAVVSGSPERFEKLRELGADLLVNYREEPNWGKVVKSWTGSEGVDQVIEIGGAGTLAQSIQAVRPGGVVSLIGVLGGRKMEFDITPVFMNAIRLQGIFVGSAIMLEQLCRAIEQNPLEPMISAVYSFEQVPEALRAMGSGKTFGKIVIDIAANE